VFSDQTIVSFLDITEKTELQQLKNALVSVVSHELRTPLTSVRGFLTLLQLNALGEVTSRTTEAASKAEANVVRLINLVNDILDVEKIEAGTIQLDFSAVAISSIVAQAAAALAEVAAEENLLLTVECLDAAVIADANRLLQAIIHLLSYAIGRSKNNDQIRIKSRLLLDGVCEISVEDQGAPIPDDQIFLLFERFAIREPAIAEGKGGDGTAAARGSILGLAICKAIVQRHGGTVGAKRGRLQGALLWFTIPARRSDGGQSFSKSGVANQ
jgi:signal transduction histidine kinase